jgi:hypothetical protein
MLPHLISPHTTHSIVDAGFHCQHGSDVSYMSVKVKQNGFALELDVYLKKKLNSMA